MKASGDRRVSDYPRPQNARRRRHVNDSYFTTLTPESSARRLIAEWYQDASAPFLDRKRARAVALGIVEDADHA